LLKIHIISDLTLLPEVHTTSTAFPTASAGLLLEVLTALAASIVLDLGARLVCSVEVVAASNPTPGGGPHGIDGPPDAGPHDSGHVGGCPPLGDPPYGIIVDA
jgi:hypothetical protein